MTDTIIAVIDSFYNLFSPFDINLISKLLFSDPNTIIITFNSEKLDSPTVQLKLNEDKTELTIQKPEKHGASSTLYNRLEKGETSFKVDSLYDFMEQLLSIVPTLRDHCVICGVLLDVQPDCYISCGNGECRFRSEELMLDNRVTEIVKTNPKVARFMLDLAYNAMASGKAEMVFEPFPYCLLNTDVIMKRGHLTAIDGGDLNKYKDMDAVKTLANQLYSNCGKLITTCNTAKDDNDIVDQIGFDLYRFIRFVLISTDSDIQPDSICGGKVKCYGVVHKVEKEEEYRSVVGNDTRYLYHGSSKDCWYSIIRNGLKVASDTKMMLHGKACGKGIYTAANYATSLSYSGAMSKAVIGVFEVSTNPKYYVSGHGSAVCVINASEALILRYLIVHNKNTVGAEVDTVFASRLKSEKKMEVKMMASKATRRLIKEFEMMQKSDVTETLGFITQITGGGDDMTKWTVVMLRSGFDPKEKITQTMEKLGIDGVELEINFPERYPFAPPFVRIVQPRFQYRTGHITIGGAICHELLSVKRWKPICKVESLLVDIRCNILEGEGDIDYKKWSIPYTFNEAKSDYVRVMNAHGWN